jgi:glycine/D-amino acid oxidase-like deaminating enzyme
MIKPYRAALTTPRSRRHRDSVHNGEVIVICPPAVGSALAEWVNQVDARVLEVAADSDDQWVAQVALAQIRAGSTVVAYGPAVSLLERLAFANRAAHRPIGAYVLVDCELPEIGKGDWPDAPVTVVTANDDVAAAAELRGWTVVDDLAKALA